MGLSRRPEWRECSGTNAEANRSWRAVCGTGPALGDCCAFPAFPTPRRRQAAETLVPRVQMLALKTQHGWPTWQPFAFERQCPFFSCTATCLCPGTLLGGLAWTRLPGADGWPLSGLDLMLDCSLLSPQAPEEKEREVFCPQGLTALLPAPVSCPVACSSANCSAQPGLPAWQSPLLARCP